MNGWHPHKWRRVDEHLQCETCHAVRQRRTRRQDQPTPAFRRDVYEAPEPDQSGATAAPKPPVKDANPNTTENGRHHHPLKIPRTEDPDGASPRRNRGNQP